MSANVIIYCLEKITDYSEFERLCNDLMVREGYKSLEPLGGFQDKGRDAIHILNDSTTIFAYSVREDWKIKLASDAAVVNSHKHTCNKFIFLTTENVTSIERDEKVNYIKDQYGWDLELYGLERLRIIIDNYPEIISKYSQIFPPHFFNQSRLFRGGDINLEDKSVSAGNGAGNSGGNAYIKAGDGYGGASGGHINITGSGIYKAGDGGSMGKGGDLIIKAGDAK